MLNTDSRFAINNVAKAYRMFEQAVIDDKEFPGTAEQMLNKLVPALMGAERPLIGDADDYHNFSVAVLKKYDEYGIALDIIQMGLEVHTMNTDLLSDAVRYAYNCSKPDISAQHYQALKEINKNKWTWRAFSFSIDYLLELYLAGTTDDLGEVLELVKAYQYYFPKEEDAWKCEQDIYTQTNQYDKGIEVLENAIAKFKLCPKCWLRYADFMVDEGNYEKAIPVISKLCTNPISADHVNMAYVFYLDGLCRMTVWQQSQEYQKEEYDKTTVESIYRCFRKALKHTDCRPNLEEKINNLARTIMQETGIPSRINSIDDNT